MLYGLEILINNWRISSLEIKQDYPELYEYEGVYYFKNKRERDKFKKEIEIDIWEKYHPAYDIDDNLEITDYGSFSITIEFETWEEKFKPIRMR